MVHTQGWGSTLLYSSWSVLRGVIWHSRGGSTPGWCFPLPVMG